METDEELKYACEEGVNLNSTSEKEKANENIECRKVLTDFFKPLITHCILPGGWNYLEVRKPGPVQPLEEQLNHQLSMVKILHCLN